MPFDSNIAWKQATAAILANRDLIIAIAGVFFLLPSLAFGLLLPAPPANNTDPAKMMAMMEAYYSEAMPYLFVMIIAQAIGSLGIISLIVQPHQTVGGALRHAGTRLLTYILAQFSVALGSAIAGALLLTLAGLIAGTAGTILAMAFVFAGMIFALVRTSLSGPLIIQEGLTNPIQALRRSWQLTKGETFRILVFYALIIFAFLLAMMIATTVAGLITSLIFGAKSAQIITVLISSTMGSTIAAYFCAIFVATYQQRCSQLPENPTHPFT